MADRARDDAGAHEAAAPGGAGLALHLVARPTELRCGYCAAEVGLVRPHACGCGATYHRDCWVELERCGTLGCGRRPTPEERKRAGRCPACQCDHGRAFRWELAACSRCGALYHLACRSRLRRCASRGCRSGRHDAWGAPVVVPVTAAAAAAFPTLAALARRAAGALDLLRPAARDVRAAPRFVPGALRRGPYRL